MLSLLLAFPALGRDELGVNAHIPADDELDALADLGVGWVRIDVNWFVVEPREGAYDWREIDRVVDGARARGLQVFATLAYAPAWASEADGDGVPTNNVPRAGAYERFVEAAVRHLDGRVTHFGMWNEPNLDGFFEGSVDAYVDRVLVPGAAAVRRACAGCTVLAPDLAGVSGWQGYLGDVLRHAADSIDVLAHHTYASPQSVRAQWACDDLDHALDIGADAICFYKPGLRQVLDEAAFDRPVWLTETGYRANPWDDEAQQDRQVRYARRVLELQLEHAWWTNTFFYELSDCGVAQPDCTIDGFGILRRTAGPDDTWADNFLLKPVFEFLRDELAGGDWGEGVEPPPPAPERPRLDAPHRADEAPDGSLDEWDDAGCALLATYEAVGAPRMGPEDLSGRACAAWSDDALWLSVDVRDDVHDNEHAAAELWMGDSVQLAIDVDADAAADAGYDDDDRELSVAWVDGETRLFAHQGEVAGATAAVRREGDRTRYELRVPLDGLAAGRALRASFLVNDADGAGREGWLEWTAGIGREKRPARFGEVALEDREAVPQADAGPMAPDMGREPPPLPDPPDLGADPGRDASPGGPDGAAAPNDPDDGIPAPVPDAARGRRSDATPATAKGDGGCSTAPAGGAGWWLLLPVLVVRRRRSGLSA